MQQAETLGHIPLNGGRDAGELIREAGEDGGTVYHAINRTQRLADRLHFAGYLDPIEHAAATAIRDAYDRAGLAMGYRQGTGGVGGGNRDDVADEKAWAEYRMLLQATGAHRRAVEAVCIDERGIPSLPLENTLYGLRCGLMAVARVCGLCS